MGTMKTWPIVDTQMEMARFLRFGLAYQLFVGYLMPKLFS